MIPTFMTVLLKKIFWEEKNKSFNISTTIIFRISIIGLFEELQRQLFEFGPVKILNKLDVIKQLCSLSFRRNDITRDVPEEVDIKEVEFIRDTNKMKKTKVDPTKVTKRQLAGQEDDEKMVFAEG
mmetsp:Transcript_35003/g.76451  ORF Transcript_35003/g.76451 Transcript_35003/m.76451 type:complete len:125 (+) Transcript_35003:142-516(+)